MSQYIPQKISDMSSADLAKMARGVGLPGLPYPMAKLEVKEDGAEWVMGTIESATDPLVIYSPHLSIEAVNRELYCNMPTPSMMSMARDLIEATKPHDVFADPFADEAGDLRPLLLVLDDRSDDPVVREQADELQAAAARHGVRVETLETDADDEVARYASLLLTGTYAAEYLRIGLVED